MANELQRIISAFIQFLFVIILPYIWWFLIVRGKVSFGEWIGLKSIKRVKDSDLISWIIGGFLLFTIFYMFVFPLQTSLPEELLFRGFLLKRMANHMPFVFANTIQAIAFGLLHGVLFASVVSLEVTFFIIFFTGAIAAYLGFVNEKKAGGSILTSWIIHALANILSGLVAAFSLF